MSLLDNEEILSKSVENKIHIYNGKFIGIFDKLPKEENFKVGDIIGIGDIFAIKLYIKNFEGWKEFNEEEYKIFTSYFGNAKYWEKLLAIISLMDQKSKNCCYEPIR